MPTTLRSYANYTKRSLAQKGFSLLETLLVVSFIGIVTTLAIPQFRSHTIGLALLSEATALQSFIELGAAYALTSRSVVSITAANEVLIASSSEGVALASHRISHGVSLDLPNSSALPLYLYPSISASPATLVVTKSNRKCSVIISLRGRVRTAC
jgi:type II secretory pathway pseudopilin PulG